MVDFCRLLASHILINHHISDFIFKSAFETEAIKGEAERMITFLIFI